MIIIVSTKEDEHTQAVLKRLSEYGTEVFVVNLSLFPRNMQLSMNYEKYKKNENYILDNVGNRICLSSCGAVWWRRPQSFELHPEINNMSYRHFTLNECKEAFSGLWLGLDASWINHPMRTEEASLKPYQLKVAHLVGFDTPLTLITNNPDDARRFIGRVGRNNTVYKSFSATEHNWRETRLLKPNELDLLDNLRFAPVIFQEYIAAKFDLRITIVGKDIFAACIHSQETSYTVDYRMELSTARIEPYDLPENIVKRLKAMMAQLQLIYGAVDMRLTPDGRFVFLEINPAGQWIFIEEHTNQPITESFAKLLTFYDNSHIRI